MPSTRSTGDPLADGLTNDYTDDEYDPDYREDSEEEDAVDDVPKSMQRDRAKWIEDNVDDVEFLYKTLIDGGRSMMGHSFLQTCNINAFANFLYRHTTPFSDQ